MSLLACETRADMNWPNVTTTSDYQLPSLRERAAPFGHINETRQGRAWLKRFCQLMPIEEDAIAQHYLEQLVGRLLPQSHLESITPLVVLVEDQQFNAFAIPGGVLGLNTGLFRFAPDQDALASVLAHELGHVSQHHYARQQEASQANALPTLGGILAGVAMAALGHGGAGIATMVSSQAVSMQRQLEHTLRQYEQEADRVGLTMLAQAGLDPKAMPRMFEVMQRYATRRKYT